MQAMLYGSAPSQPLLSISGGMAMVRNRMVDLSLTTRDHVTGQANVTDMKIWGDIDPAFLPERYAAVEGNAQWVPYLPSAPIVLTVGNGVKTLNAKIRNASDVETAAMAKTVTLSVTTPHVSQLWSDGRKLSTIDGSLKFGWSSSHDFTSIATMLAPRDDAAFEDCAQIYLQALAGTAGQHRVTNVVMSDLMAVDPYPSQSGSKRIKVFVLVNEVWYA